jgi:hypothetical protein
MKVIQVKCPKCSTPIIQKERDMLFYCSNCGVMHVRDGGVQVIDYEIADFAKGAPSDRVYVPFWRMYCSFTINHQSSSGGALYKLSNWVKDTANNSGEIFVWVPAADFDQATFKRYSTMFTASPPRYASRIDFGNVPRLPAAMKKEEAMKLADFVVVTMEAEKPGILQELQYSLQVKDARVLYLAFVSGPSGLTPSM